MLSTKRLSVKVLLAICEYYDIEATQREFALSDSGSEAINLSRLESRSVLWPTDDDKYANALALMSNTCCKTEL